MARFSKENMVNTKVDQILHIGLPFRQKDRPRIITCKLASAQDFRELHVKLASHADVLRGLSRVPALFGGKNSFPRLLP